MSKVTSSLPSNAASYKWRATGELLTESVLLGNNRSDKSPRPALSDTMIAMTSLHRYSICPKKGRNEKSCDFRCSVHWNHRAVP